MPRTDFYVLKSADRQSRLQFTCKLAQKALQHQLTLGIWAADDAMAVELDKLLWAFQPESYLPHCLCPSPEPAPPILISANFHALNCPLIINLSQSIVPAEQTPERIAEIVIQQDAVLRQTRQRYREYQERGYTLNMHNL